MGWGGGGRGGWKHLGQYHPDGGNRAKKPPPSENSSHNRASYGEHLQAMVYEQQKGGGVIPANSASRNEWDIACRQT